MQDIADFIQTLGVPIAATIALAIVLYKIGTVCGTLLVDAWKSKDMRLGELEQKVDQINNGQRSALEQRLDVSAKQSEQSTEALHKVGECLDRLGNAFTVFAHSRPCLHESDAALLQLTSDIEPAIDGGVKSIADTKTLERIQRRKDRI